MLDPSDKERLATLEADIPWIKGSLVRLELSVKEVHKSVESHLISRRHLVDGNGVPIASPAITGVSIQIGQKTAIAIIGLLSGGGLLGVGGLLKVFGVIP